MKKQLTTRTREKFEKFIKPQHLKSKTLSTEFRIRNSYLLCHIILLFIFLMLLIVAFYFNLSYEITVEDTKSTLTTLYISLLGLTILTFQLNKKDIYGIDIIYFYSKQKFFLINIMLFVALVIFLLFNSVISNPIIVTIFILYFLIAILLVVIYFINTLKNISINKKDRLNVYNELEIKEIFDNIAINEDNYVLWAKEIKKKFSPKPGEKFRYRNDKIHNLRAENLKLSLKEIQIKEMLLADVLIYELFLMRPECTLKELYYLYDHQDMEIIKQNIIRLFYYNWHNHNVNKERYLIVVRVQKQIVDIICQSSSCNKYEIIKMLMDVEYNYKLSGNIMFYYAIEKYGDELEGDQLYKLYKKLKKYPIYFFNQNPEKKEVHINPINIEIPISKNVVFNNMKQIYSYDEILIDYTNMINNGVTQFFKRGNAHNVTGNEYVSVYTNLDDEYMFHNIASIFQNISFSNQPYTDYHKLNMLQALYPRLKKIDFNQFSDRQKPWIDDGVSIYLDIHSYFKFNNNIIDNNMIELLEHWTHMTLQKNSIAQFIRLITMMIHIIINDRIDPTVAIYVSSFRDFNGMCNYIIDRRNEIRNIIEDANKTTKYMNLAIRFENMSYESTNQQEIEAMINEKLYEYNYYLTFNMFDNYREELLIAQKILIYYMQNDFLEAISAAQGAVHELFNHFNLEANVMLRQEYINKYGQYFNT